MTFLLIAVLALCLPVAIFCVAIAIATSRLEELEHEPDPPHRPIWR